MKERFKFLIFVYCTTIALMAMLKFFFLIVYFNQTAAYNIADLLRVFYHGLSLDISTAGYITALPLILLIFSAWIPLKDRAWRHIFMAYFTLITVVSAAIVAGDLGLYKYWGFRVDSTVLFYLASPREAMASVTLRDVAVAAVSFIAICAPMFFAYRALYQKLSLPQLSTMKSLVSTIGLILCGGIIFIGIRGGLSVSVANISKAYFSQETFLNHAAINPLFSLLSTMGKEDDFKDKYQFFSDAELEEKWEKIKPVREGERQRLLNCERPNILFIIGESFSESVFTKEIDGNWVMPRLQRISRQGVNFANAIANSFRTDRGVTSALYGFPAQPRTSIMKYPSKSRKLPSLASKLKEEGYSTTFVYGGDLNFTNMASMLYSTGWEDLRWQKDFNFKGAKTLKWGYDDMTMSHYIIESVEELHKSEKPFILNWLTLSSHEPFDVPYHKYEDKLLNSFAFADEAVGNVVETLRKSSAWDNLLIIIVADHAYPYPKGTKYNSLQRHMIPLIWSGGAVEKPQLFFKVVSQMDIIATLLAEMNIDSSEFIFSSDVMNENYVGRGYYTFSDGFGVVNSDTEIVYDNNNNEIISSDGYGDIQELEERGKVMLQKSMKILSEY